YLDLFKIQNRMQVYEQNIALTRRLIDDIHAKQEQGMALKNDVTRYELQMETLLLGLRRLQDQQAILNHQLCNTLGISEVSIVPDSKIVSQAFAKDNQQYWQQAAFTSSPQMEQSELSTKMAEQQLKLAKSELLPKVAVVAADNFSGPFTYDIPPIDKNINYWYVGVGVRYNLSSLFKQSKKVRQAKTGVQQSQQQQKVVAESLDNQIQQAWTLWQQTYVDLDTQKKSVELARQNYEVVNERYLNQLALITDMLDASNIRLNAELQEVDARINIVYAYYKLKFIAGTI
ncbi:MAG: TolC family protein, partial [Prevotella sp.]|nr:TolC family protein [Prevotella sp.]